MRIVKPSNAFITYLQVFTDNQASWKAIALPIENHAVPSLAHLCDSGMVYNSARLRAAIPFAVDAVGACMVYVVVVDGGHALLAVGRR